MNYELSLLDSPLLTEVQNVVIGPYQAKSPRGQHLVALGMERQAYRADSCKRYRAYRCPEHPDQIHKEVLSCMSRYCPNCAARLAQDRVERFWGKHPYMRRLPEFCHVVIRSQSYLDVPTPDQIREFSSSVSGWIESHADGRPGTGVVSHVNIYASKCKQHPGEPPYHTLYADLFWWGKFSREFSVDAPGDVEYTIHLPEHMHKILEEVMAYTPPKEPEFQARYEHATQRMRLVRQHGKLSQPKEGSEDTPLDASELVDTTTSLFAIDSNDNANNAFKPAKSSPICCKKCGNPLSEVSDWIDPYTPAIMLKDVKWYKTCPQAVPHSPPTVQ